MEIGVIAVGIAGVSALVSMYAARNARKALRLTERTLEPYVNCLVEPSSEAPGWYRAAFGIENRSNVLWEIKGVELGWRGGWIGLAEDDCRMAGDGPIVIELAQLEEKARPGTVEVRGSVGTAGSTAGGISRAGFVIYVRPTLATTKGQRLHMRLSLRSADTDHRKWTASFDRDVAPIYPLKGA